MSIGSTLLAALTIFMAGAIPEPPAVAAQTSPTFKAAVDVVSITATVRDRKGRVVRDLARHDFQVFDRGRPRAIVDFRAAESGPVSLALLFDVSGSMQMTARMDGGRLAAAQILTWLDGEGDEAALFSFDTRLREVQPFTRNLGEVTRALERLRPYGATSLYDAIAETARRVAGRATRRAAVVVVTDGVDTDSRLTPSEVAGIASAIDVPIYLVVSVSPVDHPGGERAVEGTLLKEEGPLTDLARWTGGDLFVISTPAHGSIAARQLISELRHQYLIAFEAASDPGWHPLEIRTREGHVVRTRSGYIAGQTPVVG
jgi:VWFA-related protein